MRWRTSCAVMKTGFCGFCELEKQVTAQSADRCDVPESWTWSPAAATGHACPTMSSSTAGTSGRTSASCVLIHSPTGLGLPYGRAIQLP